MTERGASLPASGLTRSRLLLLAAALLWSIGGVLAKNSAIVEIPVAERGAVLACYRALFAAAVLAPFVRWRRVRYHRGLLPTALSYAAMNILYLSALTRTTAAAAIFLQYTAVAWAVVLGWLILREAITARTIAAMVLILGAVLMIQLAPGAHGKSTAAGDRPGGWRGRSRAEA